MHVYTYSVGLPCGMYAVTWYNCQLHVVYCAVSGMVPLVSCAGASRILYAISKDRIFGESEYDSHRARTRTCPLVLSLSPPVCALSLLSL